MERTRAILGTLVFLVLAPGTFALLVPWWISGWRIEPPFLGLPSLRVAGVLLIVAGLAGLLDSFARFALEGLGTPAPIAPTRRLVVTGLYRYVRNPMYISLAALVVGQALLFGCAPLLLYAAVGAVAVFAFVVGYEEPTLRRQFGEEYDRYRKNVRRWRPRIRPWKPR